MCQKEVGKAGIMGTAPPFVSSLYLGKLLTFLKLSFPHL